MYLVVTKKALGALGGVIVSLAVLAALSWAKYPIGWKGCWRWVTQSCSILRLPSQLVGLAGVICRHELTCTLAAGSLFVLLLSGGTVLAYASRPPEMTQWLRWVLSSRWP